MRSLAYIALLCAFLSVPAGAAIYVKEVGVDPGLTMGINSSGFDGTAWVGVYKLDIYGSDAETLGIDGIVQSFCIDIWDYSPSGEHKLYQATSLSGAPDAGAGPMGDDRARYLATLLNLKWTDALASNLDAAALQAAVWEVVDEGNVTDGVGSAASPDGWNVWRYATDNEGKALPSPGNFYVSNYEVAMLANSWLGEVRNISGSDYEDRYLALSNHTSGPYYQDYVVRVPVPAASLLGIIGMTMAGIRLRRRAAR